MTCAAPCACLLVPHPCPPASPGQSSVRIPMFGCDCYAYGLLSMGLLDLVCEADLQPYDYMALVPIIEARSAKARRALSRQARRAGREACRACRAAGCGRRGHRLAGAAASVEARHGGGVHRGGPRSRRRRGARAGARCAVHSLAAAARAA